MPESQKQATALTAALQEQLNEDDEVRCFLSMRYWHPFVAESVEAVKAYDPDEIVFLPLYPQFFHDHDRLISESLEGCGRT